MDGLLATIVVLPCMVTNQPRYMDAVHARIEKDMVVVTIDRNSTGYP
jgi:hypothetical protein